MSALLTPHQFATRAVGVVWKKWRSDFQGVDCFGLVVLYFREVLGIDLGEVPRIDIAAGFHATQGWHECDPEAGATCFMSWRDGAPTHCGILLSPSEVIHAEGNEDCPGSVRVSKLRAVQQIHGQIKFYRYVEC